MRTYMRILMLSVLPAAFAIAQPPADPNNPNNDAGGRPPGGQPGEFGGPGAGGPGGRTFFFGPRSNAMFTAIDVDGDGVITARELRKAVAQLKKLDTDGDGNISLEEVSPRGGPGGPGGPAWDPTQFVDRLMENDKNADGKLSADEVTETVKPMIDGADQNGDGAFDRAELTAHMENARNRFRGGPRGGGPGGGFRGPGGFGNQQFDPTQLTGQLMQNDRNGDGKLTADEVPQQAMGMLQGGDRNGDGAIDAAELQIIMRRMGGRARGLGAGFGPGGGDDNAPGQGDDRRGDTGRRGRQRARDEN